MAARNHPPPRARIVSRLHHLHGWLGEVADSGAGIVRVICSRGAGNGQLQYPFGGIAFDWEGNLVVCDSENHRIQVFRYGDGVHLRSIGGVTRW